MGDFIRKMVSDSNEVSSKRVIAIIGTLLLVVVVGGILYGIKVQNELIYSLIALLNFFPSPWLILLVSCYFGLGLLGKRVSGW